MLRNMFSWGIAESMKKSVMGVLYKVDMTIGNNIMEVGSLISMGTMASLDGGGHLAEIRWE